MSYYLFRLLTAANTFEADCLCRDDVDALDAADRWVPDFDSIEIWDGIRHVASVQRKSDANVL